MLIFLLLVAVVGATSPRHPTESHITCAPNEKLFKPMPCPPRNCNIQYNATYSCKEQPRVSGCDCMENYSRLPNGTCIRDEYCPPPNRVCGPNETYYFEIACPPHTCDRDYTFYNCDGLPPKRGCDCKKNYVRHPHGSCVLKEECPREPICGPNERHYHLRPCPARDCESRFNNATCSGPQTYGCDCKENYFRNSRGICVPDKDCPVRGECGVNEKFYNVAPCPPLRCKDSTKTANVTCDGVQDRPGCDCKENYMRHPNGTCIFYEYCPRQCGVNETHVPCNRKCPDQYCPEDDSGNFICVTPRICVAQCACKPNYLWQASEFERCILATECPKINCTRANEEWNSCASPCRKESCDSVCDETGTQTNETCIAVCEPRCVCKKGYWRNSNSTCVPANQCPLKKKGCPKVQREQLSDDNNSDGDKSNAKDNNDADKNNDRDNNNADDTDENNSRDSDSNSSDQRNSDEGKNNAKDNDNADGKNYARENNNAEDTDDDDICDGDSGSRHQRNYDDDKNIAKNNNNADGKNNARDNNNNDDHDEDDIRNCDSDSRDQRNYDNGKNYAKDNNTANDKNNDRNNNNADDTDKDDIHNCDSYSRDQRNYDDDKNIAKNNNNADGKNNARDNNNNDNHDEDDIRNCDSDSRDQRNYDNGKNYAKDKNTANDKINDRNNNNANDTDKDDIHNCDSDSRDQRNYVDDKNAKGNNNADDTDKDDIRDCDSDSSDQRKKPKMGQKM